MRKDIPASQYNDAFELESRGLRDLFKIELRDDNSTSLYLTPHNTINYMGRTWDSLPCSLSENGFTANQEQSRPKFTIANPAGLFSIYIGQGYLDQALFTRYRVLLSDIESSTWAYAKNIWMISKTLSLNKTTAVFELRSTLDGANYVLPARQFYAPEFSHVSLQ